MDAGSRVVRRQETAGPVVEALARVAVMDWATVLRGIEDVLASDLGRAEKAVQIAELVRQAGSYRWIGLYAVTDQEITANWLERPRGACPPALSGDPRAQRDGRRHRAGRGGQRCDR